MEEVSVNIVNWNGLSYISVCLDSIFGQDYQGDVNVMIIDNASTDGSLELIVKNYPAVRLLKNKHNIGFSRAHNQAIRFSKGDYCLLLNYDITLTKNFLSEMIKAAECREDIGMVSGKLYRTTNGNSNKLLDSTGIEMPFYFQTPRGELAEDMGQFDNTEYIFGPCGAAPLYRKTMLEDIKINGEYFDEDFVNYVEDVDLAWRAQLRGWKSIYTPKAVAYHIRGVTRLNDKIVRDGYYAIGYRNRYWAMYKNITKGEFKRNSFKIILKELVFLLTKKPGACSRKVVFKAMLEAFKDKEKMKKKRQIVQSNICVSCSYMSNFFMYNELNIFYYIISLFIRIYKVVVLRHILKIYNFLLRIYYKIYSILKKIARFILKLFIKSYRKKR